MWIELNTVTACFLKTVGKRFCQWNCERYRKHDGWLKILPWFLVSVLQTKYSISASSQWLWLTGLWETAFLAVAQVMKLLLKKTYLLHFSLLENNLSLSNYLIYWKKSFHWYPFFFSRSASSAMSCFLLRSLWVPFLLYLFSALF